MNENEYSVPPVENSQSVNSEAHSTETERIKKRTYIKGLLTGAGVAIVIMFVTLPLFFADPLDDTTSVPRNDA